jgi:hypothetical protein
VALSQGEQSGKDRQMKFFNSLSEEDQKAIWASVEENVFNMWLENYENEGDEALEEEIFSQCSIQGYADLFEEYQKAREASDEI